MRPISAAFLWLILIAPGPAGAADDIRLWSPPVRVFAESMGPFGGAASEPFHWRLDCRVESAAQCRRYLVAHAGWADVPGWRIDGPALLARLSPALVGDPPRPRSGVVAASLDTLGGSFQLMTARPAAGLASAGPSILHGSVFLDSPAVARVGAWLSVYDTTGVRLHRVRLEDAP